MNKKNEANFQNFKDHGESVVYKKATNSQAESNEPAIRTLNASPDTVNLQIIG